MARLLRPALRAGVVGVSSILLHLGLVGALGSLEPRRPPAPRALAHLDRVLEAAGRVERPVRAFAQRTALVESARAARREGKLQLGAFLLEANAIDAAEEQVPFDLTTARRAFASRVEGLREALREKSIREAAPAVFGDLAYTGMPGGRMGDALLRGSGSCEPTSHLVASALHDAGLGDRVALRYYGGPTAGVTHLTVVIDAGGEEIDLLTGSPSRPGGARFAASDLVETYARAHGLEPKSSGVARSAPSSERPLFEVPQTRSLAAGYPPNADRFDSPLPLFGARAVAAPRMAGEKPDAAGTSSEDGLEQDPTSCVMDVSLALLDPPSAAAMAEDGSAIAVELALQPTPQDLERIATTILHVESSRAPLAAGSDAALIVDGCLAGLYQEAALELSLAGQADVAARAVAEAARVRERARASLARHAAPAATPTFRREVLLSSSGRAWVLLFLEGTEPLLLELGKDASDTYSEVLLYAGLVVSPKTRAVALERAGRMTPRRRMDVMHEVFRAHEHVALGGASRRWASNYVLDAPESASAEARAFVDAYRVFRPLAWRLWEAPSSPVDGVSALAAGLRERRIEPATARAITSYYVRNFVALHRTRSRGGEQIGALDRALAAAALPGVADAEDLALNPSELEALGLAAR